MKELLFPQKTRPAPAMSRYAVGLAIAAGLVTTASSVYAFDLDTGNPDVAMRWDNTVRYTFEQRMQSRDSRVALAGPPAVKLALGVTPTGYVYDGSDYLVDKNGTISSRVDLLSEFDISYLQGKFGARVSAAAWYDMAFPSQPKYAPGAFPAGNYSSTFSHGYANDQWSNYVKRYYEGPSGEFLDAFVYSNFKLGDSAWNVKAGRHAVIWGEGLVGSNHSIAYSQAPSDGMKGATNPGASAKETAIPIDQISVIAQIDPTLTLLGQYLFEWRSSRVPEGSTYFGPANTTFIQGATLNRMDPMGEGKRGNWGTGVKWSPGWLDGTLGLYYRKFDDFNPFGGQPSNPPNFANLNLSRSVYVKDVSLWGVTLSKNIFGISVGAELSHRHNAALNSKTTESAPVTQEGAIGDTWDGILNAIASYSTGPWGMWDTSTLVGELALSKLDKITRNENLFKGIGSGYDTNCTNPNGSATTTAYIRGCYKGIYLGGTITYTPVWLQVLPGVDLSAPLLVSSNFHGNSPTYAGGSEGFVTYRAGLSAAVQARYLIDINYTWFEQNVDRVTPFGRILGAPYRDKGYLSAVFQTTF